MNRIEALKAFYGQLPAREQRWILAGLMVIALFLGYTLILAPALNRIREATLEVAHARRLTAWIEREEPALASARGANHPQASPQTVVTDLRGILNTLPDPATHIHFSEPRPGVWKIRLDRTAYAGTLSALLPFILNHGLTVRRFVVERSARKPQTVNLTLELSLHAQTP
jgi:type II secretory pathway component PulM